jgi:tetratricopeptide (TPR) repeat protein
LVDTGVADAALRQRVGVRRADLELVAQLQEARLQIAAEKTAGHYDFELGDRLFAEAFRGSGLDVEVLSPEEVGERLRASSVALELAAALDLWAVIRRKFTGRADLKWTHLLRVARAADPDGWRDRVRDALEREDRQALVDLARSEEVLHQPPLALSTLGSVLGFMGAIEPAEALLRQARQRHPGDFWVNNDLAAALTMARPARWDEAIRFYTAAVALRPQSPQAHVNLGIALGENGRLDEAVAEFQEALGLQNDDALAHNNLGHALEKQGRLDEAVAAYREAIRLRRDFPLAHNNLGAALARKGWLDEAIAEYQEAIRTANRLQEDLSDAHYNLGAALVAKGRLDEAIAEYEEAIRLKKDCPEAYYYLGNARAAKGQLDEAIAAYQAAIRLKRDFPLAHNNLGNALLLTARLDEAIAAYQDAIRLGKDNALAHHNLGIALQDKGRLDEAITQYQEAIHLKEDFPEAHCMLGRILLQQGRFADALGALKRGHELGSKNPRWSYPSARLVRLAADLVPLEGQLPKLLKGGAQPANAAQGMALAWHCQEHKKHYAAATRFYAEAFVAQPGLADDLKAQDRYNAACAAALAGCGQGQDAAKLDDQERARLRGQSLTWLRADLAEHAKILEKGPAQVRAAVQQRLAHWQQDTDFAGVRGDALARLPAAERQAWQQLWADVADMLAEAQKKTTPQKKAGKE